MRPVLVGLLMAGCATTPTPDFQAERAALGERAEVLCFVSRLPPGIVDEALVSKAKEIVSRRGGQCTPELAATGAAMLRSQMDREQGIAAAQARERQDSAAFVGDRLLRGLAGFATGYAIGSTLTPPPPVQCSTVYGDRFSSTTCR